jgi:hypothetical protein
MQPRQQQLGGVSHKGSVGTPPGLWLWHHEQHGVVRDGWSPHVSWENLHALRPQPLLPHHQAALQFTCCWACQALADVGASHAKLLVAIDVL